MGIKKSRTRPFRFLKRSLQSFRRNETRNGMAEIPSKTGQFTRNET
jgi:hypothetical protein